jgi:GNAT superfamily N-acetyltransferase
MTTIRDRAGSTPELRFSAISPHRWDDLVALFGPNGACGGCWCMWWKRSSEEFRQHKGASNRRALKAQVDRGKVPGFLAYEDGTAVAWCAVEPRTNYSQLARSRTLAPVDDRPVWSVSCLFIKAGHRRNGLSLVMLNQAKRFAAERGAHLLEGYPKDMCGRASPGANSLWTGVASTYLKAGFTEVERRSPTRPIMRCKLTPRGRL